MPTAQNQPLPQARDIKLVRGDTRYLTLLIERIAPDGTATPRDLTDHSFLCQIRADKNRTGEPVAVFDVDIVGAPDEGTITAILTASEADKLGDDGTVLFYDMQFADATQTPVFVRTFIRGKATVMGDASHA